MAFIIDNPDYIEVEPVPKLNIPELEEFGCATPKDNPDSEYIIYCKPKKDYRGGCPHCGSLNYYGHGSAKPRLVHDVSMGLVPVFIELYTPRYKCNDCDRTFNYIYEDIRWREKFTERLYQQLKKRSLSESFSRVAAEYNLAVSTVEEIMLERGGELEEQKGPIVAPRILGIDEKHIRHKMRGVFVDIEKGNLLEMTKDNSQQTVIDTICSMEDYIDNIEIVTMDMANQYKPAVEIALPNAKIIVDKYHVFQDLQRHTVTAKNVVIDYLKKEIKKMPEGEEKQDKQELLSQLGKTNRLFRYSIKNLGKNKEKASLMLALCREFPELNTLRTLKEGLERIYDSKSRDQAEKRYQNWVKAVNASDKTLFKSFRSMLYTTEKWFVEIMNYFDEGCQVTNAAAEGVNSIIQEINNAGKGYGFKVLRYKTLFYEPAQLEPKRHFQNKRVFKETNDKDSNNMGKMGFGQFGIGNIGLENLKNKKEVEYVVSSPQGSKISILLKAIENDELF